MDTPTVRRSSSRHSARSSSTGSYINPLPKVDFAKLLAGRTKTPVSLQEYRDYLLHREYGAEALDFWLAIETLKTTSTANPPRSPTSPTSPFSPASPLKLSFLPSPSNDANKSTITLDSDSLNIYSKHDDVRLIDSIITRFIEQGALEEINLDAAKRNEILKAYQAGTCTADTFLNAQKHCYDLMLLNSFPRFLASEHVNGNLGPDEVMGRKLELVTMSMFTIALIICSFAVPGFPRRARWALILPAGWVCLGVLQVHAHFCFIYGLLRRARWIGMGLWSFRRPQDNSYILEPCVRVTHFYRALLYISLSLCFGVAFAAVVWAIPVNIH